MSTTFLVAAVGVFGLISGSAVTAALIFLQNHKAGQDDEEAIKEEPPGEITDALAESVATLVEAAQKLHPGTFPMYVSDWAHIILGDEPDGSQDFIAPESRISPELQIHIMRHARKVLRTKGKESNMLPSTYLILLALKKRPQSFEELFRFLNEQLGDENPYCKKDDLGSEVDSLVAEGLVRVENEVTLHVTDEALANIERLRDSKRLAFMNDELAAPAT